MNPKLIGERIRELRRRTGVSQGDLADACGVSRQAVSRWEIDGQCPTRDKLEAIARVLGVDVADVVGMTVYPEQIKKEGGAGFLVPADVMSLVPLRPSTLKRTEDGRWASPDEELKCDKVEPVPFRAVSASSRPLALLLDGVDIADLKSARQAIAIVDTAAAPSGEYAVVTAYGRTYAAMLLRASNGDVILETGKGTKRFGATEAEDAGLVVLGKLSRLIFDYKAD